MKKLSAMLPLMLFITGIVYSQGVGNLFQYSFVSPNLYCLDFGYYDAAHALGITGFDINPAGLSRMKNLSLATAYSTSKRADARIDVQIAPDSFFFGKVVLPVELGFEEKGGWDFLGAGGKIGPFAFGFGYRRGEIIGVHPSIDTMVAGSWSGSVPFAINHALFPQIPASFGTIPVLVTISGSGWLHFNIQGTGPNEITTTPITFGTALDLGPTSFGLGATMNVFKGNADITGRGEGSFDNVAGTITEMPYVPSLYKVDIKLSGSAEDDSLYQEDFHGAVTGTQFILRAGNQTTIRNLIVGELVFGGVVEEAFPVTFAGGFTNRLMYASGVPTNILIDTNNVNISIDYINRKITGTAKAALSDFLRTTISDSTANPFKLSPQTNLYFAGLYRLSNWEFNLGGGMVGFLPTGQGWGRIYVDGGVKLHQFIDWHLGFVTAWQRYQVASYSITTPPVVVVGLGGEARLFGVGLDFGVRTNTTAMILQAISETQQVELVKFNLLDWTSFGLGLKFDL